MKTTSELNQSWPLVFLLLFLTLHWSQSESYKPENVSVWIIAPRTALVQWDEPVKVGSGRILGYKLYYTTRPANEDVTQWDTQIVPGSERFTKIYPLKAFSNYVLRMQALTGPKQGEMSSEVYFKAQRGLPSQPLNFELVSVSSTSATFKWDKPVYPDDDRLKYRLHLKDLSKFRSVERKFNVGTGDGHTLTRLSPSTEYRVWLTAMHFNTEGSNTEPLTFRTNKFEYEPSDVKAQPINPQRVRVSWQPPTDVKAEDLSVLMYDVVVYDVRDDSSPVYTAKQVKALELEVDRLEPGTEYDVLVDLSPFARNPKNTVRVRTDGGVPGKVNATIKIMEVNSTIIGRLKWTPPVEVNGELKGYQMNYYCIVGEEEIQVNDPTATDYTIHGLNRGATCSFVIRARNQNGIGPPTMVSDKTPTGLPTSPPHAILYNFITCDTVRLTWRPPKPLDCNGDITKYRVVLQELAEDAVNNQELTTLETLIVIPGLNRSTEYAMQVKAYTSKGGGPFSEEVRFRSGNWCGEAVEGVEAAATSESSVQLSWKPMPEGSVELMGYHIFYVQRRFADYAPWHEKTVPVTDSVDLANLHYGESYLAAVSGAFKRGFGRRSQIVTFRVEPEVVPTDLTVKEATTNSVMIEWEPPKVLGPVTYEIDLGSTKEYMDSQGIPQTLDLRVGKAIVEAQVHRYYFSNLHPFTTYTVNVTAVSSSNNSCNPPAKVKFTTKMAPPNPMVPVQFYGVTDEETVSVILPQASEEFGPISYYHLVVVPKDEAGNSGNAYVAAKLLRRNVPYTFRLGDGEVYDGFTNKKLEHGKEYRCLLRAFVETEEGALSTASPPSEPFSLDMPKISISLRPRPKVSSNND